MRRFQRVHQTVRFLGTLIGIVLLLTAVGYVQPFNTQIQIAINQLTTGVTPFTTLRSIASGYWNFGSTSGSSGYGFRDNAGTLQLKNSGGDWTNIVSGASLPTNASFITRVAESTLSNETALGTLATGVLINTTTTGAPSIYAGTSCTNQFVRSLNASAAATCATVALSTDTSGTLAVGRGGTGLTSGTAGGVLAFTGTTTLVSSALLTQNAIMLGGGAAAAPTVLGSLGTTTTVLHGNAGGAPTFGAVVLTTDVSGILPIANGGTNSASALSGSSIMISNGTSILQGAAGTSTTVLHGNAAGAPTYSAVSLTADITGILASGNGGTGNAFFAVSGPASSIKTYTLPNANTTILTTNAAVTVAQGGTGLTSYTVGDLIYASGATTLTTRAAVAAGSYLRSNGVAAAPIWSTTTLPNSATTGDLIYASSANTYSNRAAVAAGSFLRSFGVGVAPAWSQATWPNTATTGDILYASGTDAYANLADVAVGSVLVSGGVGTAPAWSNAPSVTTLTASEAVLGPSFIVNVATTYTTTADDSGKTFTNGSDTDGEAFTLLDNPTPAGVYWNFVVATTLASGSFSITPSAGESLTFGTSTCSSITATTKGSSVRVIALNTGSGASYAAQSTTGVWTCVP